MLDYINIIACQEEGHNQFLKFQEKIEILAQNATKRDALAPSDG
jgi:hypothetical protein